jgi:hypothetical protein
VINQFLSEEIQHGPIILFLKDTEKICGNNDSYYGLKSKLDHFPEGVFIVGSHIQPDSRKEKANAGSLFLSKFPYSQAILDLALQDLDRGNDKNKEMSKAMRHLAKIFPNKVTIQPPQDEVELSRWNQMLDQDVEILKANENTSKIRSFLTRLCLECTDVETVCVKDRILTNDCIDTIVGFALSHQLKHFTPTNPDPSIICIFLYLVKALSMELICWKVSNLALRAATEGSHLRIFLRKTNLKRGSSPMSSLQTK